MQRNKYIILFGLLVFSIIACIEPYVADLKEGAGSFYVVSGEVTNHEGYQQVTISVASTLRNPVFLPVNGCNIEILDDIGHVFAGEEYEEGKYRIWMDDEYLNTEVSYRIRIITPTGSEILSAFENMPECPEIDSVYYERQELPTDNPEEYIPGLQFYVDLKGKDTDSQFYRWSIDETWEYHAPYPVEYYYDGMIRRTVPPDYSNKICWQTENVKSIYTLSTKKLVANSYEKYPLHFVDNSTTKLYIGYSALVSQYALTESAYAFWNQLEVNSKEQGGLYEQQPRPVEGNLENVTHPEQTVLGYFGASSVSTKRIFVEAIRDMGIYYDSLCTPEPLGRFGWREYPPYYYPVYIIFTNSGALRIVDDRCVDCRLARGTTVKPDFWIW